MCRRIPAEMCQDSSLLSHSPQTTDVRRRTHRGRGHSTPDSRDSTPGYGRQLPWVWETAPLGPGESATQRFTTITVKGETMLWFNLPEGYQIVLPCLLPSHSSPPHHPTPTPDRWHREIEDRGRWGIRAGTAYCTAATTGSRCELGLWWVQ